MTDAEFAVVAEALSYTYPHSFKLRADRNGQGETQAEIDRKLEFWFQMLEDLPGERVIAAVKHMCQTQRAFPSIADIRALARPVKEPIEAWAEVMAAYGESGAPEHQRYIPAPREVETRDGYVAGGEKNYTLAEPRWSSPEVEKALTAIGGLMAIKTQKPGGMETLRAQFLKAYAAFVHTDKRQQTFEALGLEERTNGHPRIQMLHDATRRIGRPMLGEGGGHALG